MNPIYNFSGGVGLLPPSVIEQVREAVVALPGTGQSVLVLDHRSPQCREVVDEAENNLRQLLKVPPGYHVIFLQGGASLQFSMVAMNLLRGKARPAHQIITGYWSAKAAVEAAREGQARVVWDGRDCGYTRVPAPAELPLGEEAAYLHYCSNETVEGVQFRAPLEAPGTPVVCDMSSDFLSYPFDVSRFALIYVHAQKNTGTAGVTIVLLRDDLLARIPDGLHTMLDYRTHVTARSIYNTPPLLPMYVVLLMTRWLRQEVGDLERMRELSAAKAAVIYDLIDRSGGFYRGRAETGSRSRINIALNLPSPELEKTFLEQSRGEGLIGLAGHRSVGGLRVSIYNPMPMAGVKVLSEFMAAFQAKHR